MSLRWIVEFIVCVIVSDGLLGLPGLLGLYFDDCLA